VRSLRALNLIGGQWQQAAGAREGDSINPANGREVGTYSAGGAADARQAIDAARRAFERGGLSPNPRQRAVVLLRWADRLAKRHDLAYLLTLENGKVLAQSQHEISAAIACLRHHACALMKAADGAPASTASQPAGVVAILVSWDAPAASLVASLAPALAAGCCAVVKPARQSVQVVAALVRELGAVEGLPSGVVNLVSEAGQEVTRELVASSGVDIVCFSGSQEAGRKMAQAVAPGAKRLLFDLARKSCSLVFPDIDVQVVAGQLAAAGLVAAGQHSSAPRCILVHVSCFDQAKLALKRALEQVTVGAGDSAGCGLGPLIDAAALVAVGVRTEQALARCDEVVLHGRRAGGELADGYFLLPTLVAERDCAAMSSHEEIYGPFISIVPFQDDRDALARANAVPMARSVSIWTGDAGRVRRLARDLNNDSIHVNRHGWLAPGGGSMHPGHAARGGLSDFLVAPGNDAIALE
jgi:acyl-CoA reductase-like NAD-dependent aldehyde dehydrogenase